MGVEKLLSAATCSYRPVALEKRRVDMLAVPHVPKQHNQNNRHAIKSTHRARRTKISASFNLEWSTLFHLHILCKKKSFIFLRRCPFACHCLRLRNVKYMCLLNAVAMNHTTWLFRADKNFRGKWSNAIKSKIGEENFWD